MTEKSANDDSDVQTGILNSYEGKMTLPEDLTEVESEAFSSLPAQVVVFPDGIQSIGDKAFANCTGLLYAVIPTSETVNFGVDVFDSCSNLILVGPLHSSVEDYALDNEMPFAVLN